VLASAVALALVAVRPAAAQILNGGFEDPIASNPFQTRGTGDVFGGWTVSGGSIDHIGNYWQPAEGEQSIDLAGNGPGAISQLVPTISGQQYLLTFAMAGNTDGPPLPVKRLRVYWGGVDQGLFTFDTTGQSRPDMGWEDRSLLVTGSGSDLLEFRSVDEGPYGPALDNVRLTAVAPEPGSMALLSTGLLGLLRRRRKQAAL
jgi:choice-of-anchor C domain-containing protein